MKVSDYIINFFIDNGINDMFGYPGAVVCHLMDSAAKNKKMHLHLNYHEQASAFAVCGYGLGTGKIAVAYSNGGPGATNLVTGIADAYYDSIPSIFIAGQVDTSDMKGMFPMRQKGIQEIPIAKLMSPICKAFYLVDAPSAVPFYFKKALYEAKSGRPGPVVLELPADVQRADIDVDLCDVFSIPDCEKVKAGEYSLLIERALMESKRPCILVGNGIKVSNLGDKLKKIIEKFHIPVVFSLHAFDLFEYDYKYNFGFIGNNGKRYSNFILSKADLIISFGARLDIKQVGNQRSNFAKNAKLIRVDIDNNELSYRVRPDEIQLLIDLRYLLDKLLECDVALDTKNWIDICNILKTQLEGYDLHEYHLSLRSLLSKVNGACIYTADVGQHEIYMAQALKLKKEQHVVLSLGLASMGFGIPAAIGAYYATGKYVVCVCGDGGFQMNSQELQFLARENIPVKIIVFNNNSLGMIREFQERNFANKCIHSVESESYVVPNIERLSNAYGISYRKLNSEDKIEIENFEFKSDIPEIIELVISTPTTLYPRFIKGKNIQDMDPPLPDNLYTELNNL
ncbi:thiamine pyrophosphate-binding protein [Treponema parvum]|uniref:Thiamine pyrophosphate-binding protein n=1 Tax=Treponema parvum TaxID=138851 RepID=A0A975F5U6_9SPIR|nr:thiamine pyrophosphate-binding protein [Treponema parvum]QTQ14529.1 thiamine pyrophosphate-binding protein [Treponema parvum]